MSDDGEREHPAQSDPRDQEAFPFFAAVPLPGASQNGRAKAEQRLNDLTTQLADFSEAFDRILETGNGLRAKLQGEGYSEHASEALVVNFMAMTMQRVL